MAIFVILVPVTWKSQGRFKFCIKIHYKKKRKKKEERKGGKGARREMGRGKGEEEIGG